MLFLSHTLVQQAHRNEFFFANVCYKEVTSSMVFAAYEFLFGTYMIKRICKNKE